VRKSRQATAETRERIVKAASEEFRRNGVERTGLAEVMAAAGMTHGGFYKHFASKEEVVAEAIASSIDTMLASWRDGSAAETPGQGLQSVISAYLSPAHRQDRACGCPFAALANDMARSEGPIRAATTEGFARLVDVVAAQLPMSRAAARKEALWILTSMVGAILMARVVDDPATSDTILREARKHLLPAAA
jgi:TetR/AcrR family transcriptional regulator, transcriptional repressor for nem operon